MASYYPLFFSASFRKMIAPLDTREVTNKVESTMIKTEQKDIQK